jgi:3-deoxy-manno-octulosonate cytidylyltransferase (CMP-KDO synthetase)
VDKDKFAMYFSREPIPSRKKGAREVPMLKQVCIIPFRKDFLITFNNLPQTPLEIVESVDMLRVLENGYRVKMVFTQHETYSVDTVEDLKKVESLMINDPLIKAYAK